MRYFFVFSLFFISSSMMAEMYVVKKGDSLWSVARSRDLSPSTIKKLNDLSQDQLYLGQKLVLPNKIVKYAAKSGDTLSDIAEKYGAKISQLVLLNNLDSENIVQGQELSVPTFRAVSTSKPSTSSSKGGVHVVSRGETLLGIALKYKMTLSQIQNLNNKKNTQIYAGERLIVSGDTPKTSSQPAILNPQLNIKTNITRHTVQPNQTLGGIALRYKVSQKDLMSWNNKQKSVVYRGETLKILSVSTNKTQTEKTTPVIQERLEKNTRTSYTVKRGDTLTSIATKFKVSVANLKAWNNKQNGNIHVNERLVLYADASKQAGKGSQQSAVYIVRRGDTLDSIAAKLKTTRSAIMSANNKKNTDIYVGEKLTVNGVSLAKVNTPSTATSRKIASSVAPPRPTSLQGIKSPRFSGIPLPIASSEIKNATPSGRGADIYLKSQTSLKAPIGGIIEYSGYINALQNVIILKLPEDRTIIYAGLGEVNVKAGQQIAKGDAIGKAGFSVIDDSAKIYMEIRDKNEVANAFHTYKDLEKHLKKKK
ncbi:MAG: LysM peptidoglycan-binding domain-containing protein [Brevinema sp.]